MSGWRFRRKLAVGLPEPFAGYIKRGLGIVFSVSEFHRVKEHTLEHLARLENLPAIVIARCLPISANRSNRSKMYRIGIGIVIVIVTVTIFPAIGRCGIAAVPVPENPGNEQTKQRVEHGEWIYTAGQIGNQQQQQIHPSTQGNRVTANQYQLYPTYPDYGNMNSGHAVQGYEGYLVPATSLSQRDSHWVTDIALTLLPFSGELLLYGARAGAYIFHLFLAILIGGAFTTIVCTFTSICSISFLDYGLTNNQVKEQVAELARTYVTPENVNAATVLVSKAFDKYTAMQREKYDSSKHKETEKKMATVSGTG